MTMLGLFDAKVCGKEIHDGSNFQWCVARAPQGSLMPDDFAWIESRIPAPKPGQVLLKTHYLGLASVMRMYMQGSAVAGETLLRLGDLAT